MALVGRQDPRDKERQDSKMRFCAHVQESLDMKNPYIADKPALTTRTPLLQEAEFHPLN